MTASSDASIDARFAPKALDFLPKTPSASIWHWSRVQAATAACPAPQGPGWSTTSGGLSPVTG